MYYDQCRIYFIPACANSLGTSVLANIVVIEYGFSNKHHFHAKIISKLQNVKASPQSTEAENLMRGDKETHFYFSFECSESRKK